MEKFIITQAQEEDAQLLTTLSVTTFCETFAESNSQQDMDKYLADEMNIAKLSDELNNKENIFFFANFDDIVIGYAKISPTKQFPELSIDSTIELERLYVLKAYQGIKAGAGLMAHCLKFAKSRHYDTLVLGVWEHNHKAIGFYDQWGFEVFGSHIFRLGNDDQTDILMKKSL